MKRLALAAMLLLTACPGRPDYVTFPDETVDSLRDQLNVSGPAALRFYDSAGKYWMRVIPTDTGIRRAVPVFVPLNKSEICPPLC